MTFTKPMTEQEWQNKYKQSATQKDADIRDPQNRANMGYYTAISAPAEPQFQAAEQKAKNPVMRGANFTTNLLGLGPAADVFSKHIARNKTFNRAIGTDVEASREFIEQPTARETTGALAQTAATTASPLIAPISMPGMIAAGAGLGYTYDVGGDLIAGESLGKTLTPGAATAVGTIAPPVLRGIGAGTASLIGRASANKVPKLTPGLIDTIGDTARNTAGVVRQTTEEVAGRAGRVGQRAVSSVTDKAAQAKRIQQLPNYARPAARVGINDAVIDMATDPNPATQDAMREMVRIAESQTSRTGRAGTRPSMVAEDAAVDQLRLINEARQGVGQKIGEMSRNLPQAQSIDTRPMIETLDSVMAQNGIVRQADSSIQFTNKAITPEQQTVIRNLYKLATQDQTLSAQQIHQMDQLFSSLQRQSRIIDKVDSVYVTVPGPDNTPVQTDIFRAFRDVYSQKLDEVAPDMRQLNQDYRVLRNLVDNIEDKVARTPGFESLPTNERFAEAGLRQMFGRGVNSPQLAQLYDVMDDTARGLGYQGARADDLYWFSTQLDGIYPQNVPPTGFDAGITSGVRGAFQSFARGITRAGEIKPEDQQKALRQLVDLNN